MKSCPNCEALLAVSARSCEYCEYEFEQMEKEVLKGVLVEVVQAVEVKVPESLIGKRIGELTIEELADLQKSKKYKPTFIWRVLRNLVHNTMDSDGSAFQHYASFFNYKHGWILSQLSKIEDNNFTNFVLK